MRHEITPGLRANSQLLYTLDEKQMYCRKNKYVGFDRYVCRVKGCQAAVNRSKPGEEATRANLHKHDHGNQEEFYMKCRFQDQLKKKSASVDGSALSSSDIYKEEAKK